MTGRNPASDERNEQRKLFEVRAEVADPTVVSEVDWSGRIVDIRGGTFEGPRLKGKLAPFSEIRDFRSRASVAHALDLYCDRRSYPKGVVIRFFRVL